MSRPSSFTQETAATICNELGSGRSLRSICTDPGMPSITTVMRWLDGNEDFRAQYARAREIQADTLFDEILDIADTPQIGQKSVSKATGLEVTEADMIEHRRLQVDARKWIASKLVPKKYGDRLHTELTGADGGPVQMDDKASAARLAQLLAMAQSRKDDASDLLGDE